MKSKVQKIREKKIIGYLLATGLLIGLIYFADIGKFLEALQQVNRFYMALAIVSGMSYYIFVGYIWYNFFTILGVNANLRKSYKLFMAGNFMNSVTPLGQLGGEPFMAYIISKNTESSYQEAFSAVASSDLINSIPFITYSTTAVIYLYLTGSINEFVQNIIYLIVVLGASLSILAYFLWSGNRKLGGFGNKLLVIIENKIINEKYIKSFREKLNEFRAAFERAGEDKRNLLKVGLIAHAFPLAQFLALYLIMLGMNIDPNLVTIFFVVILSGLAMFSPTPGGSGTFEAAFSGLMLLFYPGLELSTALAVAVLFRLTTYWPGIPFGYLCLVSLRGEEG
ncbi:MAG: hypothetical protein J07AB43_06700 [Candidatus Nanosalina sp. J07AB43]|jgi:conserved hypothetical protein|nr:MAG: hypothetical protein J07AB43_06700 [Candidatus Nanosalina sp. J07AB43]